YTAASGTLNFAGGETSKTFNVTVADDTLDEPDETVSLNLSSPVGASLGAQSTATLTINDNDAAPTLSINDAAVTEGDAGTVNAVFNVTLSAASGQTVTVNFATSDGTAAAPGDYAPNSGALTFTPGETSKNFTVAVNGDTTNEADETFFVHLSSPTNATVGDAQGQGTIANDEAAGTFLFSSSTYSADENAGSAAVTVTRTGGPAGGVSVNDATASGGTATAGSDYTAASGTLTFASGETSKTFNVPVADDTLFEGSETFNLALSSPDGGTLGTPNTAVLTINDDDAQPTLQFSSATYTVGESGTTATITVTRTGGSNAGVTVNYATSDGTATAGSDYATASGTLSFAANETSRSFNISISDDALDEPDETVNLTLSNAGGSAALGSQTTAALNITDNDAVPGVSIGDATVAEGNAGTTNAAFNVTLSAASGKTVTVNYATADGTAAAGSDYIAVSGALNFAPGETSKTVTVDINGDTSIESDETFFVNLSGATNAVIADAQGRGAVNNDDTAPAINPIDISSEFVRQHYHDFLNREPDASGLAFWTGEIEQCGSDAGCREVKRINVSAAFFLSIEFQQTGYLVERMYKAAYGDAVGVTRITGAPVQIHVPVVRRAELLADSGAIGSGVVVGREGWQQVLEANKTAFALAFVQRQRFTDAFPAGMSAGQFADKLFANAGVIPTAAERDAAVAAYGPGD
ncbi:MAG TPA: Calx-beta domain-containing protein, partial [Pyrinomonadaceae bacterium]